MHYRSTSRKLRFRKVILAIFLQIAASCGGFKIDKNSNCLNPLATCFVEDLTRPTVVESAGFRTQAEYTSNTALGNGEGTSQLYGVKLRFSEVMRNPLDKDAYALSGSGAANLQVTGIEDLGNNTFLLRFDDTQISGNGVGDVSDGDIIITINTPDYAGLKLLAPDNVIFSGAISGGIPTNTGSTVYASSLVHNDVNPMNIEFWHDITADNNNAYLVKVGGSSCFDGSNNFVVDGTVVMNGTSATLPGGYADRLSFKIDGGLNSPGWNISALPEAFYALRLCVKNATINQLRQREITVVHDKTPPVISAYPGTGSYRDAQNITLNCSNHPDKIAYTTNGSDPAFDLNRALTNGTLYTAQVTTSAGNPPVSIPYKFRCIDKAGNSSAVVSQTYTIDSTLPLITITQLSPVYLSQNSSNTATTLKFTSSVGGKPYNIYQGNIATCSAAGDIASGTTGSEISATIGYATLANLSQQTFTVCAYNPSETAFARLTFSLNRDDNAPTFSGLQTVSVASVTDALITWAPAADHSPVTYDLCRSTTVNGCATFSVHASGLSGTSHVDSGLNTNTTYYYRMRATDAAGNTTSSGTEKEWKVPTISAIANAFAGGGQVGVQLTITRGATQIRNENSLLSASGTLGPFTFQSGDTYSVKITSQPANNVCGVVQSQWGTVPDTGITLNVNCVAGYMAANGYSTVEPAPLHYLPYRGKIGALFSSGSDTIRGLTTYGNNLFYAQSNGTISYLQMCPASTCASATTIATVTDIIRHIATDGTSVYAVFTNGKKVAKYSSTTAAQTTPTTEFNLGTSGYPSGIAVDTARQLLYVGIRGVDQVIKRIDLSTGTMADISSPLTQHEGIALLGDDLYVASPDGGNCILKATNAHSATALTNFVGSCGTTEGYVNGSLTLARFARPHGLTTDGSDLYLTEFSGNRIRKIDISKGMVSTLAGSGASGTADGTGVSATLSSPFALVTNGRAFFVSGTNRIRTMVDDGLVGFWPLRTSSTDYSSSGTATNDLNTSGSFSVAQNGRYGVPGEATSFDGNSWFVREAPAGSIPVDANDRSLCAWAKPASLPAAGDSAVIAGYGGNSATEDFFLAIFNDAGSISTGLMINGTDFKANVQVPTNGWSHFCATFSDYKLRIYMNGKQISSAISASTLTTAKSSLRIASLSDTESRFTGLISDVRLYSRRLAETEIHELAQDAAQAQVGPGFSTAATGLLSRYEFEVDSSDAVSLADTGPLNSGLLGNIGVPFTVTGKDGDDEGAILYSTAAHNNGNTLGLSYGANARTVCAWVSPYTYPITNNNFIFFSYGTSANNGAFSLGLRNNAGVTGVRFFGGADNDNQFSYLPPLRSWTHLCISYDTSHIMRLYANGTLVDTTDRSANNLATAAGPLYLAAWVSGATAYDGALDDVQIYDNALSADQIRQLATQVTGGLFARYDFTGNGVEYDPRKDVSGWESHITSITGSPAQSADRYGVSDMAYTFLPGSSLTIANPAHYAGLSSWSISFWARITHSNYGFAINEPVLSASPNYTGNQLFLSIAGDTMKWDSSNRFQISGNRISINNKDPVDYRNWQNFTITGGSGDTVKIYLNGSDISSTSLTKSFPDGIITIGGSNFSGSIDDVRIYNRILTAGEIRALVTQPNKIIKLSTNPVQGDMGGVTGISGADSQCPVGYKAMIVGGSGANIRKACATSNCLSGGITENFDWVLRPHITYLRDDSFSPLFTALTNGTAPFPWANSVATSGTGVWTGLNTSWTTNNANNCAEWASAGSEMGVKGVENLTSSSAINGGTLVCSDTTQKLYCVQQ